MHYVSGKLLHSPMNMHDTLWSSLCLTFSSQAILSLANTFCENLFRKERNKQNLKFFLTAANWFSKVFTFSREVGYSKAFCVIAFLYLRYRWNYENCLFRICWWSLLFSETRHHGAGCPSLAFCCHPPAHLGWYGWCHEAFIPSENCMNVCTSSVFCKSKLRIGGTKLSVICPLPSR